MLLEARDIVIRYDRVRAVDGVSLSIADGEMVAVLGANGAGKSSLLKGLLGAVPLRAGSIAFSGQNVSNWPVARRVEAGLVLVPEGRRILMSLSVQDNLLMGAYARRDRGAVEAEMADMFERFPNLARRRHMPGSILSGGEQQMLAIGRAMLARPRLLMLDEPSLGLSPRLVGEVFALLAELNRKEGMTVLLVEQNTGAALRVATRAYVLELGKVVIQGTPAELTADGGLFDAYLGQDDGTAPTTGRAAATNNVHTGG